MTTPIRDKDSAFSILERAAKLGERCPQSFPFGPLASNVTTTLAHEGRIRIEIFAHNWRVITILSGPNRGKHTMLSPYKGSGKPYKTIGTETTINTRISRRIDALSSPQGTER